MNRGPLIFLGVFFALAASWFGLVLMPQLEIGGQQPDKADLLAKLESRENWKSVGRRCAIISRTSTPSCTSTHAAKRF